MSRQPNGGFIGKENITDNTTASGVYTLSDVAQKVANNEFPPSRFTPSRSLRFDSARSTYLSRTPATASGQNQWTFSCWFKISNPADTFHLIGGNTTTSGGTRNELVVKISNSQLAVWAFNNGSGYYFNRFSSALFRDPSAWYHLVLQFDPDNGTSANKIIAFINGVQVTWGSSADSGAAGSIGSSAYRSINNTSRNDIGGGYQGGGAPIYFSNGYMSEINMISGSIISPYSFAESDPRTGEWRPKLYTGSYGTNGFYLPFTDVVSSNTSFSGFGNNKAGIATGIQNLVIYSNNFTATLQNGQNAWLVGAYSSTSNITDPDGGSTARAFTSNAADFFISQSISGFPNGQTLNASIWMKVPSGTLAVNLYGYQTSPSLLITASKTVTVTTSWQRFDLDFTATNIDGHMMVQVGGGSSIPNGQVIHVYGGQVTAGSGVKTYVPTGDRGDFTPFGFSLTPGATYDWMVDVPGVGSPVANDTGGVVRGNYCTFNPLAVRPDASPSNATFTNGNLKATFPNAGGNVTYAPGTLEIVSGKFYWETTIDAAAVNLAVGIGTQRDLNGTHNDLIIYTNTGAIVRYGTTLITGATYTTNDVLGIAYDADKYTISFYKNNVLQGTVVGNIQIVFPFNRGSTNDSMTANFGQRPFAYTPPAGFKSLCTTNLPDPSIKLPQEHFDIKLWTGNQSSITIGNTTRERDNYEISRSLRFNRADSAFLSRTAVTPTDGKKATFSFWIKKCEISEDTSFSYRSIFYAGTPNVDGLRIAYARYSGDGHSFVITQDNGSSAAYLTARTNTRFKDVSSWFHFVIQYDSTLSSSNDRFNIYVNGVRQSFQSSPTYPPLNHIPRWQINGTTLKIGKGRDDVNEHIDMYLAEVNFIDGQALTAESFGSFDVDGSWQAKTYTGTYGNNGYYLNFSDNSNTTSTTLGKDQAGSNNWTPSGFSVAAGVNNDSFVDVPTDWGGDATDSGGEVRGNYATFDANMAFPGHNSSFALAGGPTYDQGNLRWYRTQNDNRVYSTLSMTSGKWYWEYKITGHTRTSVGITQTRASSTAAGNEYGSVFDYGLVCEDGQTIFANQTYASTSYLSSVYAVNDTIGVAYDADNNEIYISKNGVWGSSGNPATRTNPLITSIAKGEFYAFIAGGGDYPGSAVQQGYINFGQRTFEYTPPAGFKSLNTKNIDEQFPFVTGPDLVWIKRRNNASKHVWSDTVRGVNKEIFANSTEVQQTNQPGIYVNEFDSNSFTLGPGNSGSGDANVLNGTYIAYNWNAGSRTVGNQDGAITSNVRVNKDAGFSIVSYSGTGADTNVGHGLGKTPDFIIWKALDDVYNWDIYHKSLGYTSTLIFTTALPRNVLHAAPNELTIPVKHTYSGGSAAGKQMIAYCWHEVPGYSKFGSYVGNGGGSDGVFLYTGFKPRYVLIKRTTQTESWVLVDTERSPTNPALTYMLADTNGADVTSSIAYDFLSNGIKFRTNSQSESGATYVYAAFAEAPFKYTTAR